MTKSTNESNGNREEPMPSVECDHEWEVVNDSFDHEYGCEVIVFERCQLCDAERDHEPMKFDDDVM